MQSFTDSTGRKWLIEINVGSCKRSRGLAGVDIPALINDGLKPWAALVSDPVKFAEVLFCVCKNEADKIGLNADQFAELLGGDALEQAVIAFQEALIDFFPLALRVNLRAILKKSLAIQAETMSRMESKLAAIDPTALARQLIESSGKQLESLESTPPLSLSANSSG